MKSLTECSFWQRDRQLRFFEWYQGAILANRKPFCEKTHQHTTQAQHVINVIHYVPIDGELNLDFPHFKVKSFLMKMLCLSYVSHNYARG